MSSPACVRAAVALLSSLCLWLASGSPQNSTAAKKWYKGNLHTHTTHSDGDSTPQFVAEWYKQHKYHFLVLTDHNYLTDPAGLNSLHAAPEKFLLIPGEEVTDSFDSRPVHVNAIDLRRLVEPQHGTSLTETIQRNVDAIHAAGALASVNHPNFRWAFGSAELKQVRGLGLFEVYNGHPGVHNQGGGGSESLDQMWDAVLTAGRRLHGIAVDDAHYFQRFDKTLSNPGRGWVQVRAGSLERDQIMDALRRGDFYASTGVELKDLAVAGGSIRLEIAPYQDCRYTTRFIGEGGELLSTAHGNVVEFKIPGGQKYMRARVDASNGDQAWVQPVFR